jgi:signal transduction histidine kinase
VPQGLFRVDARLRVQQVSLASLGRPDFATALAADPAGGGMWVGFYEGSVFSLIDGTIRASYTAADGLGSGHVKQLRFDEDGTLWAATEGGLSRLKDGQVATLTTKNGLPCDSVHWMIEDNTRSVWLSTPCGLIRIPRADLDAWAVEASTRHDTTKTIQSVVFDASDGVPLTPYGNGYSPSVTKSSDGRLWFGSSTGVSVVNPADLSLNVLPPLVDIQRITADRKTYEAGSDAVQLPPLVRDLEITYTALSFVAPERNQFRIMLEGRDRDWQDVGTRRQAFYTDLPPRNYRFRVMASNNSGVWSEVGASLDFSIAPAYYQTTWFALSGVAVVLLMIGGLFRLRLRYVAHQFNLRLDERVHERTRIARELHDTLLQSFHGLLFRFQAATNMLPDRPAEAKKAFESAIDQAAQAITEGRDAVHDLRSSTLVTNDLAEAIGTLGNELAASQVQEGGTAPTTIDVAVEGTSRDLHPVLRDDIYRIAGEALRNAFRHARARRIQVRIHYDDHELHVRIRDDGKGIDPAMLDRERPGHYGLPGMRERAQLIGGHLDVWSSAGLGTEVDLRIPAVAAYVTSPDERSRKSFLVRRTGVGS